MRGQGVRELGVAGGHDRTAAAHGAHQGAPLLAMRGRRACQPETRTGNLREVRGGSTEAGNIVRTGMLV